MGVGASGVARAAGIAAKRVPSAGAVARISGSGAALGAGGGGASEAGVGWVSGCPGAVAGMARGPVWTDVRPAFASAGIVAAVAAVIALAGVASSTTGMDGAGGAGSGRVDAGVACRCAAGLGDGATGAVPAVTSASGFALAGCGVAAGLGCGAATRLEAACVAIAGACGADTADIRAAAPFSTALNAGWPVAPAGTGLAGIRASSKLAWAIFMRPQPRQAACRVNTGRIPRRGQWPGPAPRQDLPMQSCRLGRSSQQGKAANARLAADSPPGTLPALGLARPHWA
jgi:hypothetical protein